MVHRYAYDHWLKMCSKSMLQTNTFHTYNPRICTDSQNTDVALCMCVSKQLYWNVPSTVLSASLVNKDNMYRTLGERVLYLHSSSFPVTYSRLFTLRLNSQQRQQREHSLVACLQAQTTG